MTWIITGKEGFIGSQLKPGGGKAIVHLDAITGITDAAEQPQATFSRNVKETAAWLDKARVEGYRMVFASSAAAATPGNPYAASKAMCEMWCETYRRTYGVHVSILRFANVYGPGSQYKSSCVAQMCKDALEKGVITIHGDGGQVRDFVYVDDVCEAIHLHPDGLHGVRSGVWLSVGRIAEMISSLSGASITHTDSRAHDVRRPADAAPWLRLNYMSMMTGLERTWEYFKSLS
jgi:UDP-glucose 4-epimerase